MSSKKDNNYDWLIKLLIIGDSGVGKTNILLRFCENNFHTNHLTTIGIDFKLKTIEVDGKRIKMQIWDTAGQERFKTITQTYYKGAMGIILTYAINDSETFQSIQNWMSQIKQHANENVCKLLIGNKSDMTDRQVTFEQGQQLAQSYGIPFFETSAKEGTNINDAFTTIAKQIKDRLQNEQTPNPGTQLQQNQQLSANTDEKKKKAQKEGGGCC